MEKTRKAYAEILNILNKYKDICNYDISNLKSIAERHLFGLELKENYGLNIDPKNIYYSNYYKHNDYMGVGWWGKKHQRTIGWPDNDKQPKNELLCYISFSTGAYIFDEDYPKELFQEFWEELKSYNPKYTDSHNHCLYFSMDNAPKIFNEFEAILKKYHERNKKESKQRQIERLQNELNNLN